jgi:hypothetical protein
MKLRAFSFLAALPLLGLMVPLTAASASARTIVCQGSPSIPGGNYYLSNNGGIGARGLVRVGFTKASGPAAMGLSPGQCAWTDGAMTSTDPNSICQQRAGVVGFILNFAPNGQIVSSSIGVGNPSIYSELKKARWVPQMFSNSSAPFAMNVVSVSPSNLENCVFVHGGFRPYKAPSPAPQETPRVNPHPRGSIRPI